MERDLFSEKVGTSIELKGDFFFFFLTSWCSVSKISFTII